LTENEFNAAVKEAKQSWLDQMGEFNQLVRDDEYYSLFCKVQDFNFGPDFFRRGEDGAEIAPKPPVTKEERDAAIARLKQIEQSHHVKFGFFTERSQPNPPGKSDYSVEGSKVTYHGWQVVAAADPSTFEVLPEVEFAKDKQRVYVLGYVIPGADPKTFRVIKGPYSRDGSTAYCGNIPMKVQDIDRFEVVRCDGSWETCFDKRGFLGHFGYSLESVTVGAGTPAVTGDGWARDVMYYYYGPVRIVAADYDSFEPIDARRAKDRNHTYSGGEPTDALRQPMSAKFPPD
jgi:hypothetical protein